MKRHLLYKPIDLSEFKTMSRRKEGASFRRLCLNLYKALHGHRDHPQQQQQIIIIIMEWEVKIVAIFLGQEIRVSHDALCQPWECGGRCHRHVFCVYNML